MKRLNMNKPCRFVIRRFAAASLVASAVLLGGCVSTGATSPEQAAEASFSMPAYQAFQLANGLTVNLMPQKEVPLITVNAVVRAGAVNDTTSGLANMTAKGLMLGAAGKSKAEIEQLVDFLGASLSAGAGKEGTYISADFMAKDVDTMLPLIRDVMLKPSFEQAELAKLKQRQIAGLAQAKESPRAVIGRYFDSLAYGQHPYGQPTSGTAQSLAKVDASLLRAFHGSFYQPQNTALNIVGDFDIPAMKAKLTSLFGPWQATQDVPQIDLANNLPNYSQSKVLLVDKGDAIETTFLIGGKGVRRDNADFVGLTVVNTILGGRFTSWLNDELRVNAGLTYGARSGFVSYSHGGVFRMSTFTKAETTKEAMDLALKTYARLWEQGVDASTLESAKSYVKGQFPPKYETSGQLAGLLGDMYLYGFNESFINDFQAKVDGLTVAESQRLIAKYFPQQNLQYVLIGNASKIEALAADYGEVTKVDIKDVGFAQ
ncbi:M16 family metallopeptidase [Shewanella gelidii]|uniref:Peptidase M16 n=1 Tax=Shewanella gelidii TaxID=1642821 RepID=A0A917JUK7_9GAMM|nr:pitrilysin family protein [Shewanella gelidii]MCL1098507.1 insulinase family protein [Shewanella gelidii]GGI82189.1 peptidase M16 [Shewanella gelidii]